MEQGFIDFNTEFARYIVIAVTAPYWIPFIRKVWHEVDDALREEGGIFGRSPTPMELIEIRRQRLLEEDPLVNEPYVRGYSPATMKKDSSTPSTGTGPAPTPRRPGFRS